MSKRKMFPLNLASAVSCHLSTRRVSVSCSLRSREFGKRLPSKNGRLCCHFSGRLFCDTVHFFWYSCECFTAFVAVLWELWEQHKPFLEKIELEDDDTRCRSLIQKMADDAVYQNNTDGGVKQADFDWFTRVLQDRENLGRIYLGGRTAGEPAWQVSALETFDWLQGRELTQRSAWFLTILQKQADLEQAERERRWKRQIKESRKNAPEDRRFLYIALQAGSSGATEWTASRVSKAEWEKRMQQWAHRG